MSVLRGFSCLLAFGAFMSVDLALAEPPILSSPIKCTAQKNCVIQNYVDVDLTSAVGDYRCSKNSYDGHKGVDFRIGSIRAMEQGVRVYAAASGTVKGVRNDMQDRLYTRNREIDIRGRECGNGLVIDHGDGWETQYCHLFKGSLLFQEGDAVKRGQPIGFVGLSGKTAFPHVHLGVRHNGKSVDPFSGAEPGTGCSTKPASNSLWQKGALATFPYASVQPLHLGFARGSVQKERLMLKGKVEPPRSTKAPALVFYGQMLNLHKGDQLGIKFIGPKGFRVSSTSEPMERHKASYLLYAGKKRIHSAWPSGTYKGTLTLQRAGKQIWQETRELKLEDK